MYIHIYINIRVHGRVYKYERLAAWSECKERERVIQWEGEAEREGERERAQGWRDQ